jgi:hypothetical protein
VTAALRAGPHRGGACSRWSRRSSLLSWPSFRIENCGVGPGRVSAPARGAGPSDLHSANPRRTAQCALTRRQEAVAKQ